MILSPHHSVCGRETAPQPSTLGTPPFPPFAPVQEPLFSRRAPKTPAKSRQIPPKSAKIRQIGSRISGFARFSAFRLPAFPLSESDFRSRFGQGLVKFGNMTLSSTKPGVSSTGAKRAPKPAPASHGRVGRKMEIPQTLPFCAKTCQELTSLFAQECPSCHEDSNLGARWCFLVLSGGLPSDD
jgi:hypothetical protein